ncbi:MAG: type III secretion inner membrane ring lipoprotein SctJ [Parachlamydiaceae bacterium]|nr:type III secretion inner membrane ring lipoprotein SctJ [Parachlamydiaceae bacterium]
MPCTKEFKSFRLIKLLSYLILLCFCLPLITSCESSVKIVNGLDEKDANEILVFLSSKGIGAEKVKAESGGAGGGSAIVEWDIVVKAPDSSEAMRLLNQQGLPRRKSQNLLSIFSTSGLVPSDLQEKIKYRAALAEQLASTLRKYEGILDADVQVSFPEEDPLNPGKMKGKITASVWLKHSGVLDDPNSHLRTKIQRFVASSVTGLDPDDVTVIGERSKLSDSPSMSLSSDEEKQYVQTWSIVIAKDSLTRFRIIFFTFTILLLSLLLSLIWVIWKVLPLLSKSGGFKSLFSLHAIDDSGIVDKKLAESAKPAKKEPEKSDQGIDRDIDET